MEGEGGGSYATPQALSRLRHRLSRETQSAARVVIATVAMLVLAPTSRASWTVAKWCGRGFEVTRLATPSKLSLGFSTSHQKTNATGH